jgi:hypothetical protein
MPDQQTKLGTGVIPVRKGYPDLSLTVKTIHLVIRHVGSVLGVGLLKQ